MVYDTYDIQAKGLADSSGKCETKSPSNKRQIITIIHAGSENGWIPNNALLLSTKKRIPVWITIRIQQQNSLKTASKTYYQIYRIPVLLWCL